MAKNALAHGTKTTRILLQLKKKNIEKYTRDGNM